MKILKPVKYVLDTLNENNYNSYLVGGFVRDAILNIACFDIDIATNAPPTKIQSLFKDYIINENGLKYASFVLSIEDVKIEITSFRKDGEYQDKRKPDFIELVNDFKDDVLRRDFTINAIGYNEKEGFADFFNGIKDLENKTLRCIQNANKKLSEDPLRILRGLRFCAKYNLKADKDTKKAMIENAHLLNSLSKERMYDETLKILKGEFIKEVIEEYIEIFSIMFSFLLPMKNFDQNTPYHEYDLLTHTLKVLENVKKTPHFILAALLHDVGKLTTKTTDEEGISHYYNHANKSYEFAKDFLENKGFSKQTITKTLNLVLRHTDKVYLDDKKIKLLLNKIKEEDFFDLMKFKIADDLSKKKKEDKRVVYYKEIVARAKTIIEKNDTYKIEHLKVKGEDILQLVENKSDISKILNNLLQLVINEELVNDKEVLINYVKTIK